MNAAEWEQYAEASSYGDEETCHKLADAERLANQGRD